MKAVLGFFVGIAIGIGAFLWYEDELISLKVLSGETPEEVSITPTLLAEEEVGLVLNISEEYQMEVTSTPSATPKPTSSVTASPKPTKKPTVTPTITPAPTNTQTVTPLPTSAPTTTPSPTAIVAPQPVYSSQEVNGFVDRFAVQYGVDPNVLRAIAICESDFNPSAVNGPYVGLYQFSSSAWTTHRIQLGEDTNPDLRFNAEEAVQTAAFVVSTGKSSIWPNCVP